MKISVRNLEPTKVKLTVTVEPEELNPYLDAARKEIAKQVNVPGFRKGHVPGKIIDQRIGFAAVAGEAVNDAVPELYSKALDEKKIRPMAQPEFDVQDVPQSANDETKLKFTATVERRPDIELPEIDVHQGNGKGFRQAGMRAFLANTRAPVASRTRTGICRSSMFSLASAES